MSTPPLWISIPLLVAVIGILAALIATSFLIPASCVISLMHWDDSSPNAEGLDENAEGLDEVDAMSIDDLRLEFRGALWRLDRERESVEFLRSQRDQLLAALEQISDQDSNGGAA